MEIPSLDSSIPSELVQQEIKCLDKTAALKIMAGHRIMPLRNDTRSIGRTLLLWYLFYVKTYTRNMQYSSMNIVTNTTNKVNPQQAPIKVCDQPIFKLIKQIQLS